MGWRYDLIGTFCIVNSNGTKIDIEYEEFNRNILYCKSQSRFCIWQWFDYLIGTFCIVNIKQHTRNGLAKTI